MIIKRVITGHVVQTYDTDKQKLISQKFQKIGDHELWSDENGKLMDPPEEKPNLPDPLTTESQ